MAKKAKKGAVGAVYIITYSVGRFVLEFFRGDFFDGEGEEAGSIAETRCPSCGVRYEMDYPKCPRCGEANPNW